MTDVYRRKCRFVGFALVLRWICFFTRGIVPWYNYDVGWQAKTPASFFVRGTHGLRLTTLWEAANGATGGGYGGAQKQARRYLLAWQTQADVR